VVLDEGAEFRIAEGILRRGNGVDELLVTGEGLHLMEERRGHVAGAGILDE
jgi:hypothetical protein